MAERLDGGIGSARANPAADLAAERAPAAAKVEIGAARANSAQGDTGRDTAGDSAGGADPAGDPAPGAGPTDFSAAESKLLKALQGMR